MNILHILYHLTRADFLERSRRYSILITLGLTIFAAYLYIPPSSANYLTLGLGNHRGLYNSAWVGGAVAVLCSALLSLPAFYLVKSAIERDEQTGVGQIIATTPLSKLLYTLGKTISNFAFLVVMVGVIALSAGAMQLIRGEVFHIELWSLFAPFVYCVLPSMAVIAALAVLFETIPWLQGTIGNIVYFILWLVLLIVSAANMPSSQQIGKPSNDLWGVQMILSSMIKDTAAAFPDYQGSVAIGATTLPAPLQTFTWNGIPWSKEFILARMVWLAVALGLILFSTLLFRRFDPAPNKTIKNHRSELTETPPTEKALSIPTHTPIHLTPPNSRQYLSSARLFKAELRLLLKGVRWWWFIVFAGLNAAGLLLPIESAYQYLLPVAWVLPIAVWSTLGTREVLYNTRQLVFSAPHLLRRQFAMMWLAGVFVALAAGVGVAIKLILEADWIQMMAWGTGALFIPSLALFLGVWSNSRKLFEVVYILWWYAGPINQVENLNFIGSSSNISISRVLLYWLLTTILVIFSLIGRKQQFKL